MKSAGAFAIGGALPAITGFNAFALGLKSGASIQIGAQTNAWAINPKNFGSFLAVLGQVKQVGYAGFETGFVNLLAEFDSPNVARQKIADTGLTFFGIHIFLPPDKVDQATRLPGAALYEKVARGGVALGPQHLILSGAPSRTADELKAKIEALNTAGRFSKSLGLPLAYHNHWWEFDSKVGEIDALYSQTDPALVSFLLDAGHAYRGGADVPAFLRSHAKRLVGVHLRDYEDGKQVPLGQGRFPLSEVAATLKQLQWKGWVLNEEEREDGTKGGLTVIEPAFKALQGVLAE
ncbi:Inosose dehydratase [Acidisarcina polymorpha]|uniref:Inosose dehydratase n=1 Tax=Acidisarcina polymorpha TaxID=2211140 RepID=A0A2Z5G219_9BACT|nr:Inosose dehydratase [Acidisarcina polymorpha]